MAAIWSILELMTSPFGSDTKKYSNFDSATQVSCWSLCLEGGKYCYFRSPNLRILKIETNRSENSTAKLTLLKKSGGLPSKCPGNREKTLSLFFSPTRLSHEPLLWTTGSSYEKNRFYQKRHNIFTYCRSRAT